MRVGAAAVGNEQYCMSEAHTPAMQPLNCCFMTPSHAHRRRMELEGNEIAARVLLRAGVPPELVTAGYEAKQRRMAVAARTGPQQSAGQRDAASVGADADKVERKEIKYAVDGLIDHLNMMEGFGETLSPADFFARLPSRLYAWPEGCPKEWRKDLAACLCDKRPPLSVRIAHMREAAARGL